MSYPLDPAETIDMLSTRIGRWAEEKGFREDWELADFLEMLGRDSRMGATQTWEIAGIPIGGDRDYEPLSHKLMRAAEALRINVVGMKLALIHSEVSEALESLRDTGVAGHINGEGNFMEELADIEIRVKDLAHLMGGGLGQTEITKITHNHNRPHKHGRKA